MINRRHFVATSTAVVAAYSFGLRRGVASPNDKINLAIVGCGGRANQLVSFLTKREDVDFSWICDVDQSKFGRISSLIEDETGQIPRRETDFRRMLDDPKVDAVLIATGPNWHALATIWACQAGKDVFVEKPLCVTVHEGHMAAEAARKYNRVVQVGTQTRSAPDYRKALEYVCSGGMGEVHLLRAQEWGGYNKYRVRPAGPPAPVPDGMDWDMYCGPAEKLPFQPGDWWRLHYIYGYGTLDHATHQMDMARGFIDQSYPKAVFSSGGIHYREDGRVTPDSQYIIIEYDKLTLQATYLKWCGHMKTPFHVFEESGQFPNWAIQNHLCVVGDGGVLFIGRHGAGWQVFQRKRQEQFVAASHPQVRRSIVEAGHIGNFLDCVRSRQRPNADIVEAYKSILLCHLANASLRVGGRKLEFDAKTQRFRNAPDANKFLKRSGRAPWLIPDKV